MTALLSTTSATALASPPIHIANTDLGIDWNLERQLAELATDLSKLPEWLLKADPKTTPNYSSLLEEELKKINFGRSLTIERRPATFSRFTTTQGPWECAVAVVPALVSIAVPALKVFQVIKAAVRGWGGIRKALSAIRRGAHIHEIGEDGVKILEELLGLGDAIRACNRLL